MSDYKEIFKHYESCFDKHGDTAKGVDWPNEEDALKRYEVMTALYPDKIGEGIKLLDFGCGAGHFYEYLKNNNLLSKVSYSGLDISPKFIQHCNYKFPEVNWLCADLLKEDVDFQFDYAVLNGVFTEKLTLDFDQMLAFWKSLLTKVFTLAQKGVAFNVMSAQVDWQRDDLFHLPLDIMADFVSKNLTRHFLIRRDYGLYEYTVYLYKEPS